MSIRLISIGLVAPVTASAEQPVDAATRNKAAYVTQAQDALRDEPEQLAEMAFLTEALKSHPNASGQSITDIVFNARQALQTDRTPTYSDVFADSVRTFGARSNTVAGGGNFYAGALATAY